MLRHLYFLLSALSYCVNNVRIFIFASYPLYLYIYLQLLVSRTWKQAIIMQSKEDFGEIENIEKIYRQKHFTLKLRINYCFLVGSVVWGHISDC